MDNHCKRFGDVADLCESDSEVIKLGAERTACACASRHPATTRTKLVGESSPKLRVMDVLARSGDQAPEFSVEESVVAEAEESEGVQVHNQDNADYFDVRGIVHV